MGDNILVRYKFDTAKENDDHINNDLVCDLTEFFDLFLVSKIKKNNKLIWGTYLFNDLVQDDDGTLHISFRVPGATRGSLKLERINKNQFRIKDIYFIEDVCFGQFQCYEESLRERSKQYIDRILDFSNVVLGNNKVGDINEK